MNEGKLKTINIGLIERPTPPVRQHFNEQELSRLVASIRENGVLVPLMVRPKGDKFEVIDGDRRLKASWEAGLREVPVMVYDLNDSETHIQRMLANLDRHDTDPVSEAKYIAQIISEGTFTADQFAEKLGRSINWIADRLDIARMPEYMQVAIQDSAASLGLCLELALIKDENTKERYFREAIRNGMTVHAAKINRQMVNETIDAIAERGEEVTPDELPAVQNIPKVRCELTGEALLITGTRLVRVGIENFDAYRRANHL